MSKRERVQRVVGLATEVELPGEDVDDLFRIGQLGLGEVVESQRVGRRRRLGLCRVALVPVAPVGDATGRERIEQLRALVEIEASGVEHADHGGVALLEVAEHVGVELRRPCHATFQEREVDAREPPGHPTHQQRPARRLLRGGEVAEVVVDVVRRGDAAAPAVADAVERGGDAELGAACPQRVVVVRAPVAERVDPRARAAVGTRRRAGSRRSSPPPSIRACRWRGRAPRPPPRG